LSPFLQCFCLWQTADPLSDINIVKAVNRCGSVGNRASDDNGNTLVYRDDNFERRALVGKREDLWYVAGRREDDANIGVVDAILNNVRAKCVVKTDERQRVEVGSKRNDMPFFDETVLVQLIITRPPDRTWAIDKPEPHSPIDRLRGAHVSVGGELHESGPDIRYTIIDFRDSSRHDQLIFFTTKRHAIRGEEDALSLRLDQTNFFW
jgi:hypothetical protein